jgi:hypothetical protein
MTDSTRETLERRVVDAARALGAALDDLRSYDEARRLVWTAVPIEEFATALTEFQYEKLAGDEDEVHRELAHCFAALKHALIPLAPLAHDRH